MRHRVCDIGHTPLKLIPYTSLFWARWLISEEANVFEAYPQDEPFENYHLIAKSESVQD